MNDLRDIQKYKYTYLIVISLYVILFIPIYLIIGRPVITFFLIPLFFTARSKGAIGGIIIGCLSIPLHVLFLYFAGENNIPDSIGLTTGTVMLQLYL